MSKWVICEMSPIYTLGAGVTIANFGISGFGCAPRMSIQAVMRPQTEPLRGAHLANVFVGRASQPVRTGLETRPTSVTGLDDRRLSMRRGLAVMALITLTSSAFGQYPYPYPPQPYGP